MHQNSITLDTSKLETPQRRKRVKVDSSSDSLSHSKMTCTQSLKAKQIIEQSYWQSPEAIALFIPIMIRKKQQNEIDVKQYIKDKIIKLRKGYICPSGWRGIIDDCDQNSMCTQYDIFKIQQKCKYISHALHITLEFMGIHNKKKLTWLECCKSAINYIGKFELVKEYEDDDSERIVNPLTISSWHVTFQQNNDSFPNPYYTRKGLGL